jgi:hypothetical protein
MENKLKIYHIKNWLVILLLQVSWKCVFYMLIKLNNMNVYEQ